MYRVIAADLDGTLLKDDKTIGEETISELKRASEKGVIFLPSTGRTHRELPALVHDLPFLRYALCCNGGAVYDYEEDRYIYEDTIPHELASQVLEFAKDLPVYETVVVNGQRLAVGDDNGEVCEYIRQKAVKGILFNLRGTSDVRKAFDETGMDAQKVFFYLAEGGNRDEVIAILKERFPQLSISSSGPVYIEINVEGVDKGKALRKFCQYVGVPVEESVAFGDAGNDISMLDAAGLSVVMENGTDEAKKHADLICPSNNDDGVGKAIRDLIK